MVSMKNSRGRQKSAAAQCFDNQCLYPAGGRRWCSCCQMPSASMIGLVHLNELLLEGVGGTARKASSSLCGMLARGLQIGTCMPVGIAFHLLLARVESVRLAAGNRPPASWPARR
jgi:hypothetical protein